MSADETLKDVMDKFRSHGCSASKTSKGDKVFFARLPCDLMSDDAIRDLLRNYSGRWNTSGEVCFYHLILLSLARWKQREKRKERFVLIEYQNNFHRETTNKSGSTTSIRAKMLTFEDITLEREQYGMKLKGLYCYKMLLMA